MTRHSWIYTLVIVFCMLFGTGAEVFDSEVEILKDIDANDCFISDSASFTPPTDFTKVEVAVEQNETGRFDKYGGDMGWLEINDFKAWQAGPDGATDYMEGGTSYTLEEGQNDWVDITEKVTPGVNKLEYCNAEYMTVTYDVYIRYYVDGPEPTAEPTPESTPIPSTDCSEVEEDGPVDGGTCCNGRFWEGAECCWFNHDHCSENKWCLRDKCIESNCSLSYMFNDCDGDESNGCEAFTYHNYDMCGGCNATCDDSNPCTNEICDGTHCLYYEKYDEETILEDGACCASTRSHRADFDSSLFFPMYVGNSFFNVGGNCCKDSHCEDGEVCVNNVCTGNCPEGEEDGPIEGGYCCNGQFWEGAECCWFNHDHCGENKWCLRDKCIESNCSLSYMFNDCDGDESNGCEAFTYHNYDMCGGCNATCDDSNPCTNEICDGTHCLYYEKYDEETILEDGVCCASTRSHRADFDSSLFFPMYVGNSFFNVGGNCCKDSHCGEGQACIKNLCADVSPDGCPIGEEDGPVEGGFCCSGRFIEDIECCWFNHDHCGENQWCYRNKCIESNCSQSYLFKDCDGDESNGCETFAYQNFDQCGGCNVTCDDSNPCTSELCDGATCLYYEEYDEETILEDGACCASIRSHRADFDYDLFFPMYVGNSYFNVDGNCCKDSHCDDGQTCIENICSGGEPEATPIEMRPLSNSYLIVLGENAAAADNIAASFIAGKLGREGKEFDLILDSEVTELNKSLNHLFIVGGPSINSLASELNLTKWYFCEEDDYPCNNPFSLIREYEDIYFEGQNVILVAGWQAEHTRLAGKVYRDDTSYNMEEVACNNVTEYKSEIKIVGTIFNSSNVAVSKVGGC